MFDERVYGFNPNTNRVQSSNRCKMDLNRDIFIKLTVPKRWKGNLEDEHLLV